MRLKKNSANCHSSPKISVSSHPMFPSCATIFTFLARASCSLPLMVTPTIRLSPKTSFRTRLSTRALATIPHSGMVRRAVGLRTEKLLELLEVPAIWNREDFLGIAGVAWSSRRRPGNCAFAGCAQSRRRSADECSGARGRQLEMALYRQMLSLRFPALRELTKSTNRLGTLRRYGKLEETL